ELRKNYQKKRKKKDNFSKMQNAYSKRKNISLLTFGRKSETGDYRMSYEKIIRKREKKKTISAKCKMPTLKEKI
ncbi:hypothetical protein CDE51_12205, partial [Pasteurella multocida]